VFDGTDLVLSTQRGPEAGTIEVRLDGGAPRSIDLRANEADANALVTVAQGLALGRHTVELVSLSGRNSIDGFIVRRAPVRTGFLVIFLAGAFGLIWYLARRQAPVS
jgi:hypothetical protein